MKEVVLIIFFLMVSCSSDDGPKPGCYQDENRRIVKVINNISGTIHGLRCDGNTFLIEPDTEEQSGPIGQFNACNLAEAFQVDGIRVVFSGYIYESFDNEDICADFFEITEIRLANE